MKKAVPYILILFMAVAACKKEETKDDVPLPKPTAPVDTVTPEPVDTIPRDTVKPPVDSMESVIEISTGYGKMYMWLYKQTPKHRDNYLKLAGEGFYNNTTFHRIIPGFMIQGGDPNSKDSDPTNDGSGGPGYTIPAEIIDTLKNKRGYVAAARLGDNVNPLKASSGSQFYINVVNNTHLDNKYTVFGYIMKGIEVADSIVKQPKGAGDRPLTDIPMQVTVLKKSPSEIKAQYNFTVK